MTAMSDSKRGAAIIGLSGRDWRGYAWTVKDMCPE
jgi:hypothetical protein